MCGSQTTAQGGIPEGAEPKVLYARGAPGLVAGVPDQLESSGGRTVRRIFVSIGSQQVLGLTIALLC